MNETTSNDASGNDTSSNRQQPRRRLFVEEWMVQLVLTFAVIVALVDGALSLGGGSIV